MTARRPSVTRALTAALRDAPPGPALAGTVALAKRYCALIEEAESVAAELERLREDPEVPLDALARLRAKVDAQAVLSDLGPKLLAAMVALGMSKSAAAAVSNGGAPGAKPGSGSVPRLRERAAARRIG